MGVTATLQPVEQSGKDRHHPEPCIFVVFGASGDLTKRKLLPALFHLRQAGLLPEEFAVVGVARRDLAGTFVPDMKDGIVKGGGVAETDLRLDSFLDRVKYFQTNFDDDDGFERLKHYLAELDEDLGTRGNRLFYLAVAPEYFADMIARLGVQPVRATRLMSQSTNGEIRPMLLRSQVCTSSGAPKRGLCRADRRDLKLPTQIISATSRRHSFAPFRKNSIVTGVVPLFRHAWRVPFCTMTSPRLR